MFTRSRGHLQDSSEMRDSTLDENVFLAPQRIFMHLPFIKVGSKTFQCGDLSKHDRTLPKDNMIEASMGPTVGLATVVLFVAAARKGVEPALNLATEKESQHSF